MSSKALPLAVTETPDTQWRLLMPDKSLSKLQKEKKIFFFLKCINKHLLFILQPEELPELPPDQSESQNNK